MLLVQHKREEMDPSRSGYRDTRLLGEIAQRLQAGADGRKTVLWVQSHSSQTPPTSSRGSRPKQPVPSLPGRQGGNLQLPSSQEMEWPPAGQAVLFFSTLGVCTRAYPNFCTPWPPPSHSPHCPASHGLTGLLPFAQARSPHWTIIVYALCDNNPVENNHR